MRPAADARLGSRATVRTRPPRRPAEFRRAAWACSERLREASVAVGGRLYRLDADRGEDRSRALRVERALDLDQLIDGAAANLLPRRSVDFPEFVIHRQLRTTTFVALLLPEPLALLA